MFYRIDKNTAVVISKIESIHNDGVNTLIFTASDPESPWIVKKPFEQVLKELKDAGD